MGRGVALFDLGQLLPSEASFEQALRVNGKYRPAIMGIAEVLTFCQRYLDEHPTGSGATSRGMPSND